ncbi:MAG: hypothetical protein WBX01_03190 [Nitrososphaeraceae archaeon]
MCDLCGSLMVIFWNTRPSNHKMEEGSENDGFVDEDDEVDVDDEFEDIEENEDYDENNDSGIK